MTRVIILGAGLSGLAAADRLATLGEVIVIEKSGELGGLAASFSYRGWRITKHYHHVFSHDAVTMHYLQRFGLAEDMAWRKIRMCICYGKRLYAFTDHRLLTFDYLTLPARIRYGWFGLWALFLMKPERIPEHIDAKSWLYRKAGKEVTDKLFHELHGKNKYGVPLDKISAREFAHRLKEAEVIGRFGYPAKGLHVLIERMAKTLERRGCRIRTTADITGIDLRKKEVKLGSERLQYDILVNTIPLPEFLRIADGLPKQYASRLAKIRYCPAVEICFGTKELLSKFYWHNLINERIHIVMQHSWLYDGYDCKVSWALRYGGAEADLGLTDAEITKKYLGVVRRYFPSTRILWSKVFRERHASPIYDKNYAKNKPDYRSPVPGLYHAGVAVTYPKIRNMNTALESGQRVAEIVAADLKRR